jgi:glucose-6-phosphate 1-dehydrogenase
VSRSAKTETFAAVRLWINSWRWKGVPFYIRAGKQLPVTGLELVARLRKPPRIYQIDPVTPNHVRMELSPNVALAIGLTVMSPKSDTQAMPTELTVSRHPSSLDEESAYERLLYDAMEGDSTLFARQDYVEEAWRIVDPILTADTPVYQYQPGTWGPPEVDSRVCPPGGWENPAG